MLRFASALSLLLAMTPAAASENENPRFTARVDLTNFGTGQLAGDGDTDAWFSGKVDAYVRIRGWEGFTIDLQPEYTYGRNPNGSGNGAVLPVNTAAAFPINNKADFDMALSVSQRIDNATLTVGKINMVTRAAATPILGGGGREGFQALMLAAPISFNTPPMVLGGLLVVPTARTQVAIGLWDAQDATNRTDLHDAFQNGVAGFATVTVRKPWRGRMGFHSFTLGGTTAHSLDLRSVPELIYPPGTEGARPSQRQGGWQARYAFQQFIRQDPAQPMRGWGVFGYASFGTAIRRSGAGRWRWASPAIRHSHRRGPMIASASATTASHRVRRSSAVPNRCSRSATNRAGTVLHLRLQRALPAHGERAVHRSRAARITPTMCSRASAPISSSDQRRKKRRHSRLK